MANRRLLVKRRKAVRNIRKITRTMQLIATSRFQAAATRATATKPYNEKLAELVAALTHAAGDIEHPLMQTHDEVNRSALVAISSTRGLCGGYNAGVLRATIAHLEEQKEAGLETDVHMIGKKGIGYFKFLRKPLIDATPDIGDKPTFAEIEPIANGLIERFSKGEIRSAHVAYMRYFSAGKQKPVVIQLLPLSQEVDADAAAAPTNEYEFLPEPLELLNELLPAAVRMRLFQCFTDAIVSEQIARMVAMKAATDAADDMIKNLSRKYNRARQTAITMELLDIVGGADALA